MKKLLKPLAIAATLIAILAPAKAGDFREVHFPLRPVACRNLDDAIVASKFNITERDNDEKVDFVRRHQIGTQWTGVLGALRVPPKGDCVIAADERGHEYARLNEAVQIKRNVPGLPAGMIAICAVFFGGPITEDPPPPDCTPAADWEKARIGYWVITRPEYIMRNFDLPKAE